MACNVELDFTLLNLDSRESSAFREKTSPAIMDTSCLAVPALFNPPTVRLAWVLNGWALGWAILMMFCRVQPKLDAIRQGVFNIRSL